jgi:GNAT superfamily N-acetyltransferase
MKGPTRSIGFGVAQGWSPAAGRGRRPMPCGGRSCAAAGSSPATEILTYSREHLDPIVRMCEGISLSDPERADRAMSAPGTVALVAVDDGGLVGFSHSITDGALQAYLSMLLVSPDRQRRGIASSLIEETTERSGAIRLDLVSGEEAGPLYRTFSFRRLPGHRLYVGGEPRAVG